MSISEGELDGSLMGRLAMVEDLRGERELEAELGNCVVSDGIMEFCPLVFVLGKVEVQGDV